MNVIFFQNINCNSPISAFFYLASVWGNFYGQQKSHLPPDKKRDIGIPGESRHCHGYWAPL